MNPVMKPRLRLTSIWIQIGLIVVGAMFIVPYPETTALLWSMLAYYQVGSAIYVRIYYKGDFGMGRRVYETILFLLVSYMLSAFFADYSSLKGMYFEMYVYSLAFASLVPKSIAIWKEIQKNAAVGLGLWVMTLMILGVTASMSPDQGGLFFIGLFIMLVAGPIMAFLYLITEYREYRREIHARIHGPFDS